MHLLLDTFPCKAPSCCSALVPAAHDAVDTAVRVRNVYRCAPGLWSAVVGCGHPILSASLAAVAAELAPLTGAAIKAESTTRLSKNAMHSLRASLVLPDPETVQLCSMLHAVPITFCPGWLHGQLMLAAGVCAQVQSLVMNGE